MRILLVPDTSRASANSSFLLAKSLARVLLLHDHKVAVCASPYAKIKNCSFYRSPETPSFFPLFTPAQATTPETDLYRQKLSSYPYLRADLDAVYSAIKRFQPDLLLDLGRISTLIAARAKHIPLCMHICAGQYRSASFAGKTLYGINRLLHDEKLEQILRLEDLRAQADMQFLFDPIPTSHMVANEKRCLYRSMEVIQPFQSGSKVCICFSETSWPLFRLHHLLQSAFAGAHYPVCVYCMGKKSTAPTPIEYIKTMRSNFFHDAHICIHDGNLWVFNQCMVYGIPQLVITNNGWQRGYIADIVRHHQLGIIKEEDTLTMASLYEAYRALVSDDQYGDTCMLFAQQNLQLGDIRQLVQDIEKSFPK